MSTLIVCGRLGSDAEVKTTNGGTKLAAFSVADEIGWGDKKRTQWIKCSWFGDRAEKAAKHMTKGSMVEVVGVPQVEVWTKKDGAAAGTLSITVSEVRFHGGGKKDDGPVADRARATAPTPDDEIPF